jgi:hypothetical protein
MVSILSVNLDVSLNKVQLVSEFQLALSVRQFDSKSPSYISF